MTAVESLLAEPVVKRLGWALLHFVWQGAGVALLFAVGMWALRRRGANARYVMGVGTLLVMTALPVVTMLRIEVPAPTVPADSPRTETPSVVTPPPSPVPAPPVPPREIMPPRQHNDVPMASAVRTPPATPLRQRASGRVERILPWAVMVWLIGVIVLAVRLLGGWMQMRGLKRRLVQPVARQWQEVLKGLSGRMRLTRPVRVLESALAQVPTVIGWLKPLILLPSSALTGLSREQLEALLAHELAHIRRHDYVVNLFQTVIETLLFYHPAVWWISHRVRVERENCCDDLAVAVCGNEVAYARALTEMEQLRIATRRPAIAAGGGSLLGRIRRLVKGSARESNRSAWWLAGAVVLSAVVALAGAVKIFCSVPSKETLTNRARPLPSSTIEINGQWPQGRVIDGAGKKYGISGPVYVFDPGNPKLQTSARKQASCDMLKVLGLDFINQDSHPRVDVAFEFCDRKMSGGALFELTLLDEGGRTLARERVLQLRNRELSSEVHGGVHEIGGDDPPNRFGKAEFRFQDVSLDSAIDQYRLSVVEADIPTLVELLVHKDAYVRSSAARALGQMGSQTRDAVAPLMPLLEDRDEHVRGAAEQALQRVRSATSSAEASTTEALAESPRRLTFGGIDLTEVPAMTDPAELSDLFKPGPESGPHVFCEGVEIVHQDGLVDDQGYLGTVYFVKEKSVFYLRYGPPKWTSNRKYYGPFQGDPREKLDLESNPVWLNRLWVTWMPDQDVVKSVADLGYPGTAAKAIIRGWTPAAARSSEWEVRTSDNRRRVARIPFAWPNSPVMTLSDGKRIESGRTQTRALRLSRSQLRRLDSLEDGEYLLAWNLGGQRVSNVLRITIEASHDIGNEPLLRLMEIEPPPGERLSVLGLRAYRRTANDPAPLASAVAYPTLIVDGVERRVTHMAWTGPDAPLKVGGHYSYFLHPENYSPAIDPGRRHVIVARVGGHESAPLALTSERSLSQEWDQATAVLGPPPGLEAPRVVLAGKVINTHGKPTRGYEVRLTGKDGFTETVSTDDDGKYEFHADAVPAGEYEVSAHPPARGQPILTVQKVVLDGAQPRELDLNLEWKFSFGGRVTRPDGLPAQGWTVMGTWPSPAGTAEFNDSATADMDGRYMLRAPYEIASFVGWGGKQVRRGVRAGRTDLDFVAPEEARNSAKGDMLVSDDGAGYAKRYRNQGFELEAGFIPDTGECTFGEPLFLTFSVKNLSDKPYGFFVGGDIRGSVRHNNFRIAAIDEKGMPVRDPYSYNHFGGPGGEVLLQPGDTHTERLYLGFWCAFEKPGQYTVTCKRTLSQNGAAKYPAAPIVAAFPLRIHPYDRGEMQEVIADLGRKLRQGDKQAVYDATLGLSAIEDEAVIPHLAASLTKGDFENRLPAVKALARFSTDATLDALLVALRDPDYVVSGAAGESLRKNNLADKAVDLLLDELKSRPPAVRALAVRALGYTGVERALDPLLEAIDDPDASVRSAAAEAAGKLGSKKAIALLEARVEGDDMGVRVAAAKGLRALGQPLQVEWLTPVIRNTDDINDQNFHESIRLIRLYGGKEAAPALVSCLNFDDPSPRNTFNFFLILAIEYSPDGPKHYSEFFHDPNTDGTPEQVQQNRHILTELKAWLADYQREERESRPESESSAEALSETATDDESRTWGERVNGLRAAFELVPQKESYSIGETVGVRLHVRNVSDKAIQIVRVSGQTDSGHWIVEDSEGRRARAPRVRWTGISRKIDRRMLKPGEEAVLEVESLAIVKPGNRPAAKREVYIEKPGRYSFRYHLVFRERTEGDWSGELDTGRREILLESPSSNAAGNGTRWGGEAVEGCECRLWPPNRRACWKAEEVPTYNADVRNEGPRDLLIYRYQELCELGVDGEWYRMLLKIDAAYSSFGPGKRYFGIPISLGKCWRSKKDHRPLDLQPGKHVVQVAFLAKAGGDGKDVRFVSNPVEMEVLAPRPEGVSRRLSWGRAVNGLRAAMEVVPERESYAIGERIHVLFHLQNVSDRTLQIARDTSYPDVGNWAVEDSDGNEIRCILAAKWQSAGRRDRRALNPGDTTVMEFESIALGRGDDQEFARAERRASIGKAGVYSFRYRLNFQEKAPGDWSGELETGKYELRIGLSSEKEKETDAASSEIAVRRKGWGEPVEGVSCALWPGRFPVSSRVHWTADEVPSLRARLRNDGPRDLVVSRSPEMCELSINGRWYHMLVDVDADYSPFPPGTVYAGITIPLDRRWYTKDTNQPLRLSIGGRYFIQGAFVAKPTNKDPGPPIRFVSNVSDIEILPVRKGALVWGETVNGLRAAIEVVPEMKTYWISSWVDIRFHVENVGNKPVRIAREVGRAPDHPSRWIIEDSDGATIPCYQNSLWHGPGEVDRTVLEPGQAVWLECLESVQLGRTDEGSRLSVGRTAEISKPGRYSLRYKLVLEEKEPGDWSGTLETGKLPIDIASVPGNERPPTKPAWRGKFDAVYRLDEGEILRHIPEPFLPERADFFAELRRLHPDPFQRPSEGPPPDPDGNVFFWDGGESRDYWANPRTLGDILEALELETWEVRMSGELLGLKVQGDWVLREGAPMEQRLRSLAQILKGRFGRSVRFEKRKVEEEVIVVEGKLDLHPVKAERWRNFMLENFASLPEPALKPIHVYVDSLEKGRFRILYADTDLRGLLRELAERLRLTVIDETESSDMLVGWSMHETFRREYIQEDPSRLEELLQNLSKQTSLRFTRRPQMVERWFVVDEESGSDVPTPVTGTRVSAGSGARTAPAAVAPDSLVLRCLNAAGKPLAGVHVGRGADGSSEREPEWRFYQVGRGVNKSDAAGRIILKPSLPDDRKALLYAREEAEGLVGLLEISRDDLGKTRDIILQPECRVHGRLTSSRLRELGRDVTWTNVYLFAGEQRPLGYMSEQQRFEFFLPPGEYRLEAYGTELDELERPIEVREGQRDLEIDMDLPPTRLAKLIGKPAPELQRIKGWKNGGPVSLGELRGKYVLLDFWGYWCGPCVRAMPELMLLHEAFGDRGLVIIGVHDDSVESIQDMDARLAGIREKMWMGRDIPFLVALDGGGETPIEGSTRTARGATTAAYGIHSFPTKVLIDRDGKVVEEFHAPSLGEAITRFEGLLGVKAKTPSWRKKFDALYRLEEDEVLRNIPEPYIPERSEFFFRDSVLTNRILAVGRPYHPARSLLLWDGREAKLSSASPSKLTDLLQALGIREVEIRGPEDLLELEVSGDWVVREDSPIEERLESLVKVLKEKYNRSVRFEKRRIEEEVIVASGRFQFHPLPGYEEDRQAHLYIDQLEEQHGGGTGTVGTLLRYLERIIHKQVINELQSPEDARVVWRTHVSGSRRTAANPPQMTTLLDNLSKQTSLQFRTEKRRVERWFVSEVNPDPDPKPEAES